MLFTYIGRLRSLSVETRKRLVWWYTSACTFAVVLVWLGVLLLGGGQQYSFGTAARQDTAVRSETQKASAREHLNSLRAEVGYPPLPTTAPVTDTPTAREGNATPAPLDPEAYAHWQNSYFSEESAPVGATGAVSTTPAAESEPSLERYE